MGMAVLFSSCKKDDGKDPEESENQGGGGSAPAIFVSTEPQNSNVLIEELIPTGVETSEDGAPEIAGGAGVSSAGDTRGDEPGLALGRAWFQAPDVDGTCVIRYDLDDEKAVEAVRVGKVVTVKVLAANGVDLDTMFIQERAS